MYNLLMRVITISLFLAGILFASVPQLINYQGYLSSGNAAVADGGYQLTFTIYDAVSGGSTIWSEIHPSVPVSGGSFSVFLGSITALTDATFADSVRYLGIQVGSDPEISPRSRLVSSPYALRTSTLDGASGGAVEGELIFNGPPGNARVRVNSGDSAITVYDDSGNPIIAISVQGIDGGGAVSIRQQSKKKGVAGPEKVRITEDGLVVIGATAADTTASVTTTGITFPDNTAQTTAAGASNGLPITGGTMTGFIKSSTGDESQRIEMGKGNFGPGNVNTGGNAFAAGAGNTATGDSSSISGGADNTASARFSTIGGGNVNTSSADFSTVSGGESDTASGVYSTVSGGKNNIASDTGAFVGGGGFNRAKGFYSVVGGGGGLLPGDSNVAGGDYSVVSGGRHNLALGSYSTVGGGGGVGEIDRNIAGGIASTIGGGTRNMILGSIAATIAGGSENSANAEVSTIGGGTNNSNSGLAATISGGSNNNATGSYSTISGGGGGQFVDSNSASGSYSTIGGGRKNVASGEASTVAGGVSNSATGRFSFASGRRAKANHDGAVVFSDSLNSDFASTAPNQFFVRAIGGVSMYTNGGLSAGVTLAAGGSSWSAVSDSTLKRNVREVDYQEVLDKVVELSVSQWSYESQEENIEHIGPMAQDFYRLFGLGEDNVHINTLDPDGIALAAIKALNVKNEKLEQEVQELKELIKELLEKEK